MSYKITYMHIEELQLRLCKLIKYKDAELTEIEENDFQRWSDSIGSLAYVMEHRALGGTEL
jgi:hypothetical protein